MSAVYRRSTGLLVLAALALAAGCTSAPRAAADREPDEQGGDALLAKAGVPHAVVSEVFVTPSTPAENLDSPASWRAPDGRRWLIATAKGTHQLAVFDGNSGVRMRTIGGKGVARGNSTGPMVSR